MEFEKNFNPEQIEEKIYNFWMSEGYFLPEVSKLQKLEVRSQKLEEKSSIFNTYTIVIPPPNITGSLHIGHALNNTIQDILIRYYRMKGFVTLWLPGTDHAGIATQNVVEKKLRSEKTNRHEIGREKFIAKVWEWKEQYGNTIIQQLKKLGCSCDWSRLRFTMDESYSEAIKYAFIKYFNDNLIYKDEYIINWCPRCYTAISDIEVEYVETKAKLYYIRYFLAENQKLETRSQKQEEKNYEFGHTAKLGPANYKLKNEKQNDERFNNEQLTINNKQYLTIATTRPETLLGDTAVCVNPLDERYKHLIGKKVVLPILKREIPIIADDYAEASFGTGVVKVTPAHDLADFEAGKRNNLPIIVAIDSYAKMTKEAGPYAGMDRYKCREKLLEDLQEKNLLEKIEDYDLSVSTCSRCHTVIEPLLSNQWFVRMKKLAQPAIKVVEENKINFVPEKYKKVYLDWMNNIKDWCISRQLWWGHQIPVWYCLDCLKINKENFSAAQIKVKSSKDKGINILRDNYELGTRNYELKEQKLEIKSSIKCKDCGGTNLIQDPDVLDTWFSSALWPFATLGWPEQTKDLKIFYPTSVLSTDRGIIFLWVARMIFSGLYFMGDIPFSTVYIHSTVFNKEGKRMSKSLGTGINPLDLLKTYGADATRFGIILQTAKGQDLRFSEERLKAAKSFATKIWNAVRFCLQNEKEQKLEVRSKKPENNERQTINDEQKTIHNELLTINYNNLSLAQKWILSKINKIIKQTTELLNQYEFNDAANLLYKFFWNDFCDWFIEISKMLNYELNYEQLTTNDEQLSTLNSTILNYVLTNFLKLLHPFMPFISEELWEKLTGKKGLIIEQWPIAEEKFIDEVIEKEIEEVFNIVKVIRNLRSEANYPPQKKAKVEFKPLIKNYELRITNYEIQAYIKHLANVDELQINNEELQVMDNAFSQRTEEFEIYLMLDKLDLKKEIEKLQKEKEKLLTQLETLNKKFANNNFIEKAKKEIIEKEKIKREQIQLKLDSINRRIRRLED